MPRKAAGPMLTVDEAVDALRARAKPARTLENNRVGIRAGNSLGVSVPDIRAVARLCGRDNTLAGQLWATGIHEARQLAPMVADPQTTPEPVLEAWVGEIESWDVGDGFASFVADTPYAWNKVFEWSAREEEFVRRCAFATIASLTHDRRQADEQLLATLPLMRAAASDPRNFVKKAVNWALREVGKRNLALNAAAIECALAVQADGTRPGRWIAADALRELRSEAVQARLAAKHP